MIKQLERMQNLYFRLATSILSFPISIMILAGSVFLYHDLRIVSVVFTIAVIFLFAELHAVLLFYGIRQLWKTRQKILLSVLQIIIEILAFVFLLRVILILYLGYAMTVSLQI